jgi:hypothetical protein
MGGVLSLVLPFSKPFNVYFNVYLLHNFFQTQEFLSLVQKLGYTFYVHTLHISQC